MALVTIYTDFVAQENKHLSLFPLFLHLFAMKRWEYQTTWPACWETYMQVRKWQLELDMEQQTGSKKEKEYIEAVYRHPAYLTQ